MYGTVARIRIKPGTQDEWCKLMEEQTQDTPGLVGLNVYQMDGDPNEYFLSVVFQDKESYFKNANSPEQDRKYRELAKFFAFEPEWHDGEIIFSRGWEESKGRQAA